MRKSDRDWLDPVRRSVEPRGPQSRELARTTARPSPLNVTSSYDLPNTAQRNVCHATTPHQQQRDIPPSRMMSAVNGFRQRPCRRYDQRLAQEDR